MKSTKWICLYIFFNLSLLLVYTSSSGQLYNDRVDFQTWSDINLTYFQTQKFSIGGDAGLRGIISSKNWNLFYVRPTINYTLHPIFRISGGIGSFNTINKELSNTYEIRFFQDAHVSWPDFGWIDFYHRIRIEERFFFYKKIANDFSIRGRYLIRARTTNFKIFGSRKTYYLKGMWEAFIPLGESAAELFVNNQRWYTALGYQPSDRFRYELFYIWQKSREFVDDGFKTSENIFRFRIFYTLKLPD
jgi:hypothetical protein